MPGVTRFAYLSVQASQQTSLNFASQQVLQGRWSFNTADYYRFISSVQVKTKQNYYPISLNDSSTIVFNSQAITIAPLITSEESQYYYVGIQVEMKSFPIPKYVNMYFDLHLASMFANICS